MAIVTKEERPIIRLPQYLSPSAMSTLERCEQLYYYTYMSEHPRPKFTTGLAANIGSAFDILVKYELAKHIGQENNPRFWPDSLIEDSIPEDIREHCLKVAGRLLQEYYKTPYFRGLLDAGISDMELDLVTDITLGDKTIPVRVKPDLSLADGTIFDWKVMGAASKSGASPKPGYTSRYINGKKQSAHKFAGRPLEMIDESWARQLAVGSWALKGISPVEDIRVMIDNLSVSGTGTIVCSRIDTIISIDFQLETFYAMYNAWQRIHDNDLKHPSASPRVCNMYGELCTYAGICPGYKEMQEVNELYG